MGEHLEPVSSGYKQIRRGDRAILPSPRVDFLKQDSVGVEYVLIGEAFDVLQFAAA
jgi:hypothetical protein